MGKSDQDGRIPEVLRHFHPPSGFTPWHGGPTALGALRGVSVAVASWRPSPDRHTIWELALHVAYWNYAVERRLTDGPENTFPRSPSNFPAPSGDDDRAWKADRGVLREYHDRLRAVIADQDPASLEQVAGGKGGVTRADLITGVLLHDTYHAGQIQLMKRLARSQGIR